MDIHSGAHQSDPDKAGDNEEGKYTHEQQLELKMRVQDIEHELAQMQSQIQKLAGLLHDLGKVILDTYFHEQYAEVVEEMIEEERSALDAETDILNIDHAEVGGWLPDGNSLKYSSPRLPATII